MPVKKKRGAKKNQTLQKMKLLKTRLIKISMVIDDYVYKHKPISIKDAQSFVEEVSEYKFQCGKDVRSLQVIEKITRCMKAIITEHQEKNDDIIYNDSSANCPSPVYSLPDEDKILLTHSLTFDQDIETERNNINDDTIDLCDDEDSVVQRNIQVDVEIHRAMSNLSIRENDSLVDEVYSQSILDFSANRAEEIIPSVPSKQVDPYSKGLKDSLHQSKELASKSISLVGEVYSQSILEDFSANRAEEIKQSVPSKQVDPYSKRLKESLHQSKEVARKLNTPVDCSQSILKDFDKNLPILSNNVTTASKKLQIEVTNNTFKNFDRPTHIKVTPTLKDTPKSKIAIKNVQFTDKIEVINLTEDNTAIYKNNNRKGKSNQPNKKPRKSTKIKEDNAVKRKKTDLGTKLPNRSTAANNIDEQAKHVTYNNVRNDVLTTLTSHKANTSMNVNFHQQIQSADNSEQHNRNNNIDNKSMTKIYNKNIIDDLSWIENIRYVREIAPDEFDEANVDNIFWENYALPVDWNETYFD